MNTRPAYKQKLDFLVNVLLPVALGSLVYRFLQDRAGLYPLIRNYLPDGLWAYAFLSCILIIWKRKINKAWVLVAFCVAALFEYLQFIDVIAGTGDWIDVCVYFLFFGLALLSNKYVYLMKSTAVLKKNVLSALALLVFFVLAAASTVSKIPNGAFNKSVPVEDAADTKSYLVKNDGTKIYGSQIVWKSGLVQKNEVKIDDQKFSVSEIAGYKAGSFYYARMGRKYLKRIVRGKINVYMTEDQVLHTSGATGIRTYETVDVYYMQKGEQGEIIVIKNQKAIAEAVNSCPLAADMASQSGSKIRKAVEHDDSYMNEIFEIYNNDCHPLK